MKWRSRISSMLTVLLSLLVSCGCFFNLADSISCYRCDALDSPKSDCPGWNRRAVNSIMDLRDRGGLYTHCVDVRLANGTVLHQDVVPALPMCKSSFLTTWKNDLQAYFTSSFLFKSLFCDKKVHMITNKYKYFYMGKTICVCVWG